MNTPTLRILLVDDSQSQYTLIRNFMSAARHLRCVLDWAAEYSEAMEIIRRDEHNVYLIDYYLDDGHTGLDIIRQAIELGCKAPMILLTGNSDHDIERSAIQAGAIDYLDITDLRPSSLERSIRYSIERARTLVALRESEERYRDLFENSTDLIQSVNPEGRYEYVNRVWCETLGYAKEEVAQLTLNDVIHPDYIERCLATFNRVLSGQEVHNAEAVFCAKDGRQVIVEGNISCRMVKGKPPVTRGIFRDVTARKQIEIAEHEQRLLAEALRDTAATINSTLNFNEILHRILVNVERVVPHDSGNIMLIEDGVAHIVHFNDYTQTDLEQSQANVKLIVADTPSIQEIIETGQTLIVPDVGQYPGWVDVPESRWIRSYIGLPIISDNRVIGLLNLNSKTPNFFTPALVAPIQAFSNQVATAIQNAHLYQQAQELAAMNERQRIARDLHDAVSQTLFSANLIAETLPRLSNSLPANILSGLHELHTLTQRAHAEMRSLLFELRPQALESTLISDLLYQLGQTYPNRQNTSIEMDIQADIALPVEVKAALYRITQEALNNIAKHSLANEVRLKLSEHDAVVKFVISDKGRGFDHSRVEPGHFGLAIMRERANAVGGNLDIESQIEHGTKIVFTWARRQIDRPGLFR